MENNVDEILFRCSGLGDIMSKSEGLTEKQKMELAVLDAKEKPTMKQLDRALELHAKRLNPGLPDGAKTHCIDVFVSWKYGRMEEIKSKYTEKGSDCEEDAISLYTDVSGNFYKKNNIRLNNEFITGEPDLSDNEEIQRAKTIIDIKTSWSAHTFFRAKFGKLNSDYDFQGQGYLGLTGADTFKLVYALVNATPTLIDDEKRKALWGMGNPNTDTPEYKAKAIQIEMNMIYDLPLFRKHNPNYDLVLNPEHWYYDIPAEQRVHEIVIPRNQAKIDKIYQRVQDCREWIKNNLI